MEWVDESHRRGPRIVNLIIQGPWEAEILISLPFEFCLELLSSRLCCPRAALCGWGCRSTGASFLSRRWATKKAGGFTQNGRDSKPKNLGVKKCGGQKVIPGNIIVRQGGIRFHPGDFAGMGRDHTLFALAGGQVKFAKDPLTGRKWVHVEPTGGPPVHPAYSHLSSKTVGDASALVATQLAL